MNDSLVREVFADTEFVKGLFALETPQEVQSALKEKGLDLSTDDIVTIRDYLAKRLASGEELSDEELAGITGGSVTVVIVGILLFGTVGAIGTAMALTTGAAIVNTIVRGAW